jgi:hypoxanthine phosphoribosyltransferase
LQKEPAPLEWFAEPPKDLLACDLNWRNLAMTDIPAGTWFRLLWISYKYIRKARSVLSVFIGTKPSLSWDEYDFAIKVIAFRSSRFNPDIVIGIGIGGTIAGATLAGNMNKKFFSIDREVEWNDFRQVKILDAFATPKRKQLFVGKRVLIVSAEIISGQSTKAVYDYIMSMNPANIKTACIDFHQNSATYLTPDFYYIATKDIIQKPWRLLPGYTCPDDNPRPN